MSENQPTDTTSLAIIDATTMIPTEATSMELLRIIAEQNAANIKINLANLVGQRERSTATALTIGAGLADTLWLASNFGNQFGSGIAEIVYNTPVVPVVAISGIVLTAMAVRRWMNVGKEMGKVLDYQPGQQNARQPKS